MRFCSIICLIFILCGSADSQEWIWNSFDDGAAKVLLPGETKSKSFDLETDLGILTQHTHYVQDSSSESGNYLYTVTYVDYPSGTFHTDSLELINLFFETILEGSVISLDGELIYEDSFFEIDRPGKIWKIMIKDQSASVKTKSVLHSDRLYTLQVFTIKAHSNNDNIDRFLKSFKLESRT